MILRHGNICLPPCLGRWRFESLEDLTAHFELLCSDPRDQAVAIAIKGMLTEARPSRMRWELLFEQRHVIGACFLQLKQGSKYPFCLEPNYKIFINRCFLMLERRFGRLAMWAQEDLTTRRLWFPDVNAILDASGKVLVRGGADHIFYAELDTSLLAVEQDSRYARWARFLCFFVAGLSLVVKKWQTRTISEEIDREAMELVEQEEEEESKARVGHAAVFAFRVFLLSMQLCTVRVCTAQQRVSADLPEMDVAMQAPAMQMLVLIVAAALQHSETNEDVQAFAQKLDQMIPALYHLHFLVTKDRTELLQNLRLLCCVLTSARNWMQALPCSSAVGIVLVESGLVPRRDCQGSIVGNLELYVPENAEDNSVLPEVRADVQTFRDLHEELRLIVDPTADETWSSVLRSCRDAQVALEARM